jgi:flavin-dependent dehydrogenase
MTQKYDLVIVGAGPAGLMAAKIAGEKHLHVALIERRRDITNWTRADCMMFYGLEEDLMGEDIRVEVGKIIFPRNGFEVKYSGGLYPLYHQRIFSPGGHRIDFSSRYPIAIVFDKKCLLTDLLGEVEKLGVTLFPGTLGIKAENIQGGAKVLLKSEGTESWIEGKKVIAADGINSRITESIGLNKDRTFMGTYKVIQYLMEGVENPFPNSWIQFYGKSISSFAPPHFLQTAGGERLQRLGFIKPVPGNPEEDLKNFLRKGSYVSWFTKAKVAYKMGVSVKAFMPIERPVMGNVLAIGDAAALAEVENQGALMCGYHAAHAVIKELEGGSGFEAYLDWWQRSFEFFTAEISHLQNYTINAYYEDEEIDYLFSLVEGETLEGTVNQYKFPKKLWDAILGHKERIKKERPELNRKIENLHKRTIQEAYTVD